jgi:citrate synthase
MENTMNEMKQPRSILPSISSNSQNTLVYRGIKIDDLVGKATFEEVVYLLWHGTRPDHKKLVHFQLELSAQSSIGEAFIQKIQQFNKNMNILEVIRIMVNHSGIWKDRLQNRSKNSEIMNAVKLIAQLPTIVTAYARARDGKEPIAPKRNVSIAHNFLYMLHGKVPDRPAIQALDQALILYADQGMDEAVLAAQEKTSTSSDIHLGIAAALDTMIGVPNGSIHQHIFNMLLKIETGMNVEDYIAQHFSPAQTILGFGKKEDSRSKHLEKASLEFGELRNELDWHRLSKRVDIAAREKELFPNAHFFATSLFHNLQIPPYLFISVFVIGRLSGWIAYILEQLDLESTHADADS